MRFRGSLRLSTRGRLGLACVVATLGLCALPASGVATPGAAGGAGGGGSYAAHRYPLSSPKGSRLPFEGSQHPVCAQAQAGSDACLAHVLAPAPRLGATITSPTGLSPNAIKSVYGYPSWETAGVGETVAIVDAYNDPDAASDLGKFSAEYGLPVASLTQVNQSGGSSLPRDERELGSRDQPRHRVGPRARPWREHPAGRGEQQQPRQPTRGRELRGRARELCLQQLGLLGVLDGELLRLVLHRAGCQLLRRRRRRRRLAAVALGLA